jgi:ketosteroid isomerase-like protein
MAHTVSGKPLSEGELAESRELDRRFCEALGRKDLDAAMACFWDDPDVVVVIAGNVQKGPAAVRSGIKQLFDQNESLRVEVSEITYLRSGDGIIGVGTATFDLKPVNGKPQLMVERWSDLRRKINGRWVYVLDHATMVPK